VRLRLPDRSIEGIALAVEVLAVPPALADATATTTAAGWPVAFVRAADELRAYYWFDGVSVVAIARGDVAARDGELVAWFAEGAPELAGDELVALADVWAGCEEVMS
jgi:hypothetical protein